MTVLKRYKENRAWNINANIVLADFVSTSATALVIDAIQARLATSLQIVALTSVVDGAISLVLFASLHAYANRARGVKDIMVVQLHRWILSPLHYLIGAALQFALLALDVRVGITVVVAYLSAVVVVRAVHTVYGRRTGLFK